MGSILLFTAFCGLLVTAAAFPTLELITEDPNPPTPEDPTPLITVTTCGGFINSSSALISLQSGGFIPANQHCVWVIQAPFTSYRFRLNSSQLSEDDGIYLTEFWMDNVGFHHKVESVGTNYTFETIMVVITLAAGHAPTGGFDLEFFSSGHQGWNPFTGYFGLNSTSDSFSYPGVEGANYGNNEMAYFVVNPLVPGQKTLRFVDVDVEYGDGCKYDAIVTFNWYNNAWTEVARFCGNTIPPSATLEAGIAMIALISDISETAGGFTLEYI